MKELRNEIMDYLIDIPGMNKNTIIAILNPLKTEKQAKEMLGFLFNNPDITRIDVILKKSLEISNN